MADLDKIEKGLDEALIAQEIELKVAMALKAFPVTSPVVSNYREAQELLATFYQFLMATQFGATVSDTMARGFVTLLLHRAVGVENAADQAISGVSGGVLNLLELVAKAIAKQMVEQYVEGTIADGLDLSDWDDKVALAQQYVRKYGGNVPPGKAQSTAQELAPHAEELLKNHMKIAGAFRKLLGK